MSKYINIVIYSLLIIFSFLCSPNYICNSEDTVKDINDVSYNQGDNFYPVLRG